MSGTGTFVSRAFGFPYLGSSGRGVGGVGGENFARCSSSSLHNFPPRKKRRNGLKGGMRGRRHFGDGGSGGGGGGGSGGLAYAKSRANSGGAVGSSTTTTTTTTTSGSRKRRPLVLLRTSGNAGGSVASTTAAGTVAGGGFAGGSSQSSTGGGRTSGSEMSHDEGSTHYECDSEGTSASMNSEISLGGADRRGAGARSVTARSGRRQPFAKNSFGKSKEEDEDEEESLEDGPRYRTLREVIRVALALVLDHAYRYRGGYKLSPAERRRSEILSKIVNKRQSSESPMRGQGDEEGMQQKHPNLSELAFLERKEKLLAMLGGGVREATLPKRLAPWTDDGGSGNVSDASGGSIGKLSFVSTERRDESVEVDGGDRPPFTIQRVAEVLVTPERYYTQTHKLCNGLEKLLLVTSSSSAFGGSTGGHTSQSLQEEIEIAALADQRGKEVSALRQRRLKRRMSSSSDGGDPVLQMNVAVDTTDSKTTVRDSSYLRTRSSEQPATDALGEPGCSLKSPPSACDDRWSDQRYPAVSNSSRKNPEISHDETSSSSSSSSTTEANRSPLNDAIQSSRVNLDEKCRVNLDEKRNMGEFNERERAVRTVGSSICNHLGSTSMDTNDGHECMSRRFRDTGSDLLAHHTTGLAIRSSNRDPLYQHADFRTSNGVPHGESDQLQQRLQESVPRQSPLGETVPPELQHRPGVARPPSPILFPDTPGTVPGIGPLINNTRSTSHALQVHHPVASVAATALGTAPAGRMDFLMNSASGGASSVGAESRPITAADVAELEVASNSDVDSESGDSLDDSASDRSDGSDSGSGAGYYEPFTAARVMALNRMQQQQRREQYLQSRALASLGTSGLHYQQSDGFRPPPDSEYQSGDSIDSTMAEDSGGSDSSNSDFAD